MISEGQRGVHLAWLLELTQIPTAAGREQRVIRWIRDWIAARPELELREDAHGNMHVAFRDDRASRPVYFTAHLDHPAFVVERIVAPGVLELSFRGGVMEDYFKDARVSVVDSRDWRHGGVIRQKLDPPKTPGSAAQPAFPHYLCELDEAKSAGGVAVGDVCVWELPPAEVIGREVHTAVCDDLAAAAAAIAAMDVLVARRRGGVAAAGESVPRLLFTRAEEIGFVGAIAACRGNPAERLMPADARVVALENSRSFADSPINGGPIVRVGDRLSVFSPSLSGAIAARAEQLAGGAAPTASQKLSATPAWKWQRKLMSGGACEATVYCHAGYEATCVCLPLGNYHNMAELTEVQAGTNTKPARVGREFIGLDDYNGLVDLLVACGTSLPDSAPVGPLVEKLWRERAFVLES